MELPTRSERTPSSSSARSMCKHVRKGSKWKWKVKRFYPGRVTLFALGIRCAFFHSLSLCMHFYSLSHSLCVTAVLIFHSLPFFFHASLSLSLLFVFFLHLSLSLFLFPSIHSLICSLIYPLIHSFAHSLTHSFAHSSTRSLARSLTDPSTRSLVRPFTRSLSLTHSVNVVRSFPLTLALFRSLNNNN